MGRSASVWDIFVMQDFSGSLSSEKNKTKKKKSDKLL